eukprot:m.448293 g.448293  ORF g.448293 m.448293 type:complete len:787 (+) comp19640_c0_seq1:16-2376(+)
MASSAGLRSRKKVDGNDDAGEAPAAAGTVSMARVLELQAQGRVAMVVDGVAYDFTDFTAEHPGGPEYLKKNAGKVATEEFVASHPVDIIERTLSAAQFASMRLGPVDKSTVTADDVAVYEAGSHAAAVLPVGDKPSLESCINIYDFEAIASRIVPMQGWVYYSSGSDDEITLRENHNAFHRLWLKPRVMVNVKEIDMSTTILGHKVSMPMFLSAVAMCKLGHPEGETAWTKGAEAGEIIYMVPTLSGCSFDEIVNARKNKKYPMFFQLYVNQDKEKVKTIVQKAEKAGCTALFITCDAPQLGNRERDRRVKVTHSGAAAQGGKSGGQGQGTSKALTTFIDPSLSWDDLPFFKSITKMKIVLKGIATAEDAVRAYKEGCAGVLLSNHGGRQLDFARSAIEILPEVMAALNDINYDKSKFEVFIDGGVRRGSDIFKAIALGAKAVGVGRPALYAMSSFGAEGVARMIEILKGELHLTMQLMGTPTLADINPKSVIVDNLASHIAMVPPDMLQRETYIPPVTQARANSFDRADGTPPKADAPAAAAAGGTSGGGSPPVLSKVAGAVLKELLSSVLGSKAGFTVGRSAMFLIMFLVVHLVGNLALFKGEGAFNEYCYFLNTPPVGLAIKVIEYYLLLAFLAHAGAASLLTLRFNKLKPSAKDPLYKYPLGQAKLALTGSVAAVFIVLHVLHFRFSEKNFLHDSSHAQSDTNMHALVLEVVPQYFVLYAAGIIAIGIHLWSGWAKVAKKMGLAKEELQPAIDLGQNGAIAMTVGFLLCLWKASADATAATK